MAGEERKKKEEAKAGKVELETSSAKNKGAKGLQNASPQTRGATKNRSARETRGVNSNP